MKKKAQSTIQFAKAYHVNMDPTDFSELGPDATREEFKSYFNIPEDADEDPNYKRDPDFDSRRLRKFVSMRVTMKEVIKKKAGSYDDFLMNYSQEIRQGISQLREIKEKIKDMDENDPKWAKVDSVMSRYDRNVNETIQYWALGRPDAREIANFAIGNMNTYGTEPQHVVFAIGDFLNALR